MESNNLLKQLANDMSYVRAGIVEIKSDMTRVHSAFTELPCRKPTGQKKNWFSIPAIMAVILIVATIALAANY